MKLVVVGEATHGSAIQPNRVSVNPGSFCATKPCGRYPGHRRDMTTPFSSPPFTTHDASLCPVWLVGSPPSCAGPHLELGTHAFLLFALSSFSFSAGAVSRPTQVQTRGPFCRDRLGMSGRAELTSPHLNLCHLFVPPARVHRRLSPITLSPLSHTLSWPPSRKGLQFFMFSVIRSGHTHKHHRRLHKKHVDIVQTSACSTRAHRLLSTEVRYE